MYRVFLGIGALVTLGAVLGFGCGGDDGDGGGDGSCEDLLAPEPCFLCVEASCCESLSACLGDAGCADCLAGNASSCSTPLWNDLYACGASSCEAECIDVDESQPDCGAPADAPSAGSCVAIGPDGDCNPITNEGCDESVGEVCDANGDGKFECYPPPPPSTAALCMDCGTNEGEYCQAGMTCVGSVQIQPSAINASTRCAKWCCDDGDCGPAGQCTSVGQLSVGICTEDENGGGGQGGTGGTGGSGGAGGSGGGGGTGGR